MARLLPRFFARQEEVARLREISQIVAESEVLDEQVATAPGVTLAGDRRRLRGVPVVGGVSGTSPGSDPVAEVLRRESERERRAWV